jgi:hypothetical protein
MDLNCWDTFTRMLNEMVKLDEMLQGYGHKHNPDRKVWDLQYHEPHVMWKAIGRKGGVSVFSKLLLFCDFQL